MGFFASTCLGQFHLDWAVNHNLTFVGFKNGGDWGFMCEFKMVNFLTSNGFYCSNNARLKWFESLMKSDIWLGVDQRSHNVGKCKSNISLQSQEKKQVEREVQHWIRITVADKNIRISFPFANNSGLLINCYFQISFFD